MMEFWEHCSSFCLLLAGKRSPADEASVDRRLSGENLSAVHQKGPFINVLSAIWWSSCAEKQNYGK